jgi:hypothetical protein
MRRNRKRGKWRSEFQPDGDFCLGELSRPPVCLDEEESDEDEAPVVLGGEREAPVTFQRLKVAAERGQLEAMYLLAQECDDPSERIRWLTLAAERGHVPAMHDLGLASAALHERRRWLLRAARHGWAEAMAELGDVECS